MRGLTHFTEVSRSRDIFFGLFITRVDHTLPRETNPIQTNVTFEHICVHKYRIHEGERKRNVRMLFARPLQWDTCMAFCVIVVE